MTFKGWQAVAAALRERDEGHLNAGQVRSLHAIADRLTGGCGNPCRGVVLADEVGMGKTRVAVAVTNAVVACGGRVAIAVPGGLGYQWSKELADDRRPGLELLRSLWGFLQAYDQGRRWDREPVVLVSHNLPNWRMRSDARCGRWRLVPALVAEVRKQQSNRYPNDYGPMKRQWVGAAAAGILAALQDEGPLPGLLEDLAEDWRWKDLDVPRLYQRDATLGHALPLAIGWGLGRFDLVVIDEAHKGKGDETMVTRLLGDILRVTEDPARLALTATPVAMHVDEWARTLRRVGVPSGALQVIGERTSRYAKATHELRATWRTSERRRHAWESEARAFEQALRPYVLRRDKREDDAVVAYSEFTRDTESYRRVDDVVLQTHELPVSWRRVVVGSEALSTTVGGAEDMQGKRLRLTVANGHGIAALIGSAQERAATSGAGGSPRHQRAADWERLILDNVGSGRALALLDHPQIRRAAEFIDEQFTNGQKVLVFGRFSAPIHALNRLVNARARVRAVVGNRSWPQESPWTGERGAETRAMDQIAAKQLGISPRRLSSAMKRHDERYKREQTKRAWLYKNLPKLLPRGLGRIDAPAWAHELVTAVPSDAWSTLGRGIWELLPVESRTLATKERRSRDLQRALGQAFVSLAIAALDDDPFNPEDRPKRDAAWLTLQTYVSQEFSPRRSRAARVLDGSTPPPTRRLLQAAFNRPQSEPRALIAQSIVGREGLNLHEACRVVLLFHPEWNPGVVEQQIGRVDRIGSRWQRELAQVAPGTPVEKLPRIEVHALVFAGTYDEHNWRVLKRRWIELRAQLHGVVIPMTEVRTAEERLLADRLNAAAPSFRPPMT